MNYFLNEEQEMIRDLVKQIAQEKVAPLASELDEKGEFPWELMKLFAESDLFALFVPEEYGGLGKGVLDLCIVIEELSKACAGVSVSYAASALGTYPIILFGSEEQKKKYLPAIAKGEKLTAFGLTESDAGSDAGGIRTAAVRDGDYYILNGNKQWITNGGEAEIYTVIALTDRTKGSRGASAFIVE
ncbi:MAG TPA: acyl-CoA dehydrogenase, partial [Candidatus Atribacteria bacterium]|nr:acyl-CoA dehydrogenase [Candidatus Atribacteria bacterium]